MSGDETALPDPEAVAAEAHEATTDGAVNLAVTGEIDPDAVERTADGYVGETAGALGRLAAAVTIEGDLAVHYPDPDLTAGGPWLVLAPLSGFVSTVATGTGRAVVDLDYDASADPSLDGLDERVSALLDAAAPGHDHYPVADDERGAFTTGMTTFALDSLSVGERLTATFDVSTTPATSASGVESQFAAVAGVESVTYEPVVGVERSSPSSDVREAVETAHCEVRGQCDYEWLADPGAFGAIPSAGKMALGTGAPGAGEFSREQYETCRDLLDATLSNLGVSA